MTRFLLILLSFTLLQPKTQHTEIKQEIYPTKNELLGKINPEKHPDFVKIDDNIGYFPEMYLRKQTYNAFLKMREAAAKDGINLTLKSALRTYDIQKYLWNQKFTGKRSTDNQFINQNLHDSIKTSMVLEYSSMPGISRHHWGTDIDINSTNHSYFYSGEGKKVYNWLLEHAEKYGFYQVYIPFGEKRKTGFKHEEWHWTYKPESDKFIQAYKNTITYKDIKGFYGDKYAKSLKVIENYVYGINPKLLPKK